jgi:hypothetical protein
MATVFGLSALALVVQAVAMTYAVRGVALLSSGTDEVSLSGILTGLGVGVSFAAAISLGHRLFRSGTACVGH